MLSNWHQKGLMVRRSVDRGQFVHALRQAALDSRTQHSVLSGAIQSLEECKLRWIERRRLCERVQLLDDDMRMSLDLALRIQLLRRREVICVWVDKETSFHALDPKLYCEILVRWNRIEISGVNEFGRGHVRRRGNHTHRRGIARSTGDLLSVRNRQVGHRQAEVDEIV